VTVGEIKFYTDEHIQKAVAEQLRAREVDVLRCQEAGTRTADDQTHLELAVEQGRVLVTRDDDFLRLHAEWMKTDRIHTGIVFVTPRRWNDIGAIIDDLLLIHRALEPEEMYNQVWFI
jgi:uncharacterized protein with PIN domain